MISYPLQTERLAFRAWREEDLGPFSTMNADKEVMEFFPCTLQEDETIKLIEKIQDNITRSGYGLYAVEQKSDRCFIGFIGLSVPGFSSFFTPCVEIGWRLCKQAWGRGYATEGAKAVLTHGFETLEMKQIYSFTSVQNKRSERVMQKIGMQKITVFDHPGLEDGHMLKPHVLYLAENHLKHS